MRASAGGAIDPTGAEKQPFPKGMAKMKGSMTTPHKRRRPEPARPSRRARLSAWAQAKRADPASGRLTRFFAKTVEVIFLVARVEVLERVQLHAQALTYDTILGVVPLLAVIFAIAAAFGGIEDLKARLQDFIISSVGGATPDPAFVTRVQEFVGNIGVGRMSTVSALILAFSATQLLGHIEGSFNAIFGISTTRPWVARFLTYWAALTLGPIVLTISLGLTAALQTSSVAEVIRQLGFGALLIYILPLMVTWLGFFALYVVVPATRVRWTAALFAAIVAGSLWNASKYGYALYVKNAATVQNLYGSLATVPLFILFVYVSWLLVLFGAQLAFAWQNASTYHKEAEGDHASFADRERVACRLLLEAARDFFTGRPPTELDVVTERLGIPRRLLESLAGELKSAGLLREVEDAMGGVIPGRDLDRITINDVLEHLRHGRRPELELVADDARLIVDEILGGIDHARHELTGKLTLRALCERLGERESKGREGTLPEQGERPVH